MRHHRGLALLLAVCAFAAAAVAWPGAAAPAQDKPTTRTATCADAGCHADLVSRPVMHQPVAARRCLDCHEHAIPERHVFRLVTPRQELCESCHALDLDVVVHAPVATRNCTGCHDPHGSEHPLMLVRDPLRGLCLDCHEQDYAEKEFVHGPVAVGACIACHRAHSGSQKKLLIDEPNRLCVDCHAETVPDGPAARHMHRPMRDGCLTCHDPHASDARHQLIVDEPTLCTNCHEGVKESTAHASFVHEPAGIGGRCTSCHRPHFSRLPRLQRAAQPDLCLECHDESIRAADGRMLTNMAALLAEQPNHHGPIRQGGCTACHQPHAGEHFALLFEDYPAEFYAPYEPKKYALCFSCHLSDMVVDRSGTGLTGFRDGDTNLHWLHVNREKGRTCRACHEVHASKRPFHMREAVPFGPGQWMLEINFEKTDDGGTCAPACHKERTYTRVAAAAPPGAVAPEGQP